MNTPTSIQREGPWTRPTLGDTRPRRSFGGLYRTAEGERAGTSFGGIPLVDAEDSVTAAVRLGYKIADAQIERGRRIARRLSGAAERAGVEDAGVPLEAMERLITNAVLSGLEWIEGAASDRSSPIKRFATAEFRLLGAMLGLLPDGADAKARSSSKRAAAPPAGPAPIGAQPVAEPAAAPRRLTACQIRHKEGAPGRAVRIVGWDFEGGDIEPGTNKSPFFNAANARLKPIEATLEFKLGAPPVLEINALTSHQPGLWRAAVRAAQIQIGIVEIEI